MNFNSPVLFPRWLFKRYYLNLKKKIHRHSRLSIILIFKKLNSIETLVKGIPEIKLSHWSLLRKTSHMITQTLIASTRFVFYSNNCLDPFRIMSYRESTVAAPISSLARYIKYFLSPGLQYRFYLKIYSLFTVSTVETSITKQSVGFLYSWTKSHHIFAPLKYF